MTARSMKRRIEKLEQATSKGWQVAWPTFFDEAGEKCHSSLPDNVAWAVLELGGDTLRVDRAFVGDVAEDISDFENRAMEEMKRHFKNCFILPHGAENL